MTLTAFELTGKRVGVAALAICCSVATAFAADTSDAEFVAAATRALTRDFKDPDTVKYRDVFVARAPLHAGESRALCGEVNGKNSYGGYAGYRRFVILDGPDGIKGGAPIVMSEDYMVEISWSRYCGNPEASRTDAPGL